MGSEKSDKSDKSEKSDKSDKSDKSGSEESYQESDGEYSEDSDSDSESYLRGYRVGKNSKKVHASHWAYEGPHGPEHWGELKPSYAVAKTGTCQSPIDLTNAESSDGVEVSYNYKNSSMTVLNNGHTIQNNYAPGSTLTINGAAYELKQFHFHLPSEHTVDGQHRAMEMHLVHANAGGQLAVLGVFIEEGEENQILAPIWNSLPPRPSNHSAAGTPPPTVVVPGEICASQLLPAENTMFRYSGSLTTPPCTEGVYWLVLQEPIHMGRAQITKFRKMFRFNNRPVQNINDRCLNTGDQLKCC